MEFYRLSDEQKNFAFDFILNFKELKFEEILNSLELEYLINFRKDIIDFLKKFPDETQAKMYDNEGRISYTDKEGIYRNPTYTGGESAFIVDINRKADEYLAYLDKVIQRLKEKKRPKEFPLFGRWNDIDNPEFFISKKGVLGCVAEYIDSIILSDYPDNEDKYRHLHKVFYKHNGEPYSRTSFKGAKDRNTKARKNKCRGRNFTQENCVEFLHYLLHFNTTKPI